MPPDVRFTLLNEHFVPLVVEEHILQCSVLSSHDSGPIGDGISFSFQILCPVFVFGENKH